MDFHSFDFGMDVRMVKAPGALANETIPATYIDMADADRIVFLISWGALDADDTIDVSVKQATSSAGAGSKALSGAVITQVVDGDDSKFATIEVRAETLDVDNAFRFVAVTVAQAGATAPVGSIHAFLYRKYVLPITKDAAWKETIEVV